MQSLTPHELIDQHRGTWAWMRHPHGLNAEPRGDAWLRFAGGQPRILDDGNRLVTTPSAAESSPELLQVGPVRLRSRGDGSNRGVASSSSIEQAEHLELER